MEINYEYFEGSKNPLNLISCIKNNMEFNKNHPDYFKPEGITVFCGSQGEGKTLSATELVRNICREHFFALI